MRRRIFTLGLLCILLLSCAGCKEASAQPRLLGQPDPFSALLLSELPDHELLADPAPPIGGLSEPEDLAICLDLQLDDNVLQMRNLVFRPQGLATFCFAIDRDQTDLRPQSWQALLESDLAVGFVISGARGSVTRRAMLGSLAHGLGDSRKAAISYLRQLQEEGRLNPNSTDCPVTLCLDAEAVELNKSGRNLELIIPSEGTLSFSFGLIGTVPVPEPDPETLLDAGFRLTDGSCRADLYPDKAAYASASRVSDWQQFHRITGNTMRDLRRTVFHTRLFNSANGRENVLMITSAILLILIWAVTALHRSNQKAVIRWIWLITGLTVGWLALSMCKYMLRENSLLSRILWYGYYFFSMGLPLAALHMAAVLDRPACPHWLWGFIGIYGALLALVFTNDFHQLVFQFDPAGNWSSSYSYGVGYYLVFAFTLLTFLLSIVLLVLKARKNPRQYSWVWPGSVAVLLVAFNAGYVLRVPLCRDSNLTLVFSLFSVLFAEALLHCGYLPMNLGYRQLFSSSPLQMQLMDRNGMIQLHSVGAAPLTEEQRASIFLHPGVSLAQDSDILLHSCPIHGGTAIWQENISEINCLQKKLKASIGSTQRANALLQQEQAIQRKKLSSEIQEQLFDKLEADIADQARELSALVQELPSGPERKAQMAFIPMVLCHIKRRCNLFFLAQEGDTMSSNELAMYLDELSEFAGYAGIQALCRCGISGSLPVNCVTFFYDFYFTLLSWAQKQSHAILIARVVSQQGSLLFSVLSSHSTASLVLPAAFRQTMVQLGAELSRNQVEERETLTLVLPLQKGGSL